MEVTASVYASAGAHVRSNVCQRETLLHLFLGGNGEAKLPPAHTVTGAKKGFKQTNKQKKNYPQTNNFISQNNRLVTPVSTGFYH